MISAKLQMLSVASLCTPGLFFVFDCKIWPFEKNIDIVLKISDTQGVTLY